MSNEPKRFVRILSTCPQETIRGEVGVLKREYSDGTVLVVLDNGDRVCLARKHVEPLS